MVKDYKDEVYNIRHILKQYIVDNNLKSLVLGISGGIDSALCAVLAKPVCDELNIPLIGRSITIKSNKEDEINRAKSIGKNFCTNFDELVLNEDYDKLINTLTIKDHLNGLIIDDMKFKFRSGNLKARIRMIMLYDIAQATNGIVLSTDNYTEYLIGFWTLHGDVGDYGMIQELWKTEVYEISDWLIENELSNEKKKALIACVECQATDGLGITNTDLDQILPDYSGTSRNGYKIVDDILRLYIVNKHNETTKPVYELNPVISRHLKSSYKRNNPCNIPRNKITFKHKLF